MANVIVVGAQWGDEGKAKITDLLASEADVVVRCQGGCNAGHTVKHDGQTFKFHLIPSGMLYAGKTCVIGNGVVLDPAVLLRELAELKERGYAVTGLKVSSRAHLTLPHHVARDQAQETAAAAQTGGVGKIGTTGKGIGPTYMDKVGRYGLRVGDLYETDERLTVILSRILRGSALPNTPEETAQNLADLLTWCRNFAAELEPYVTDTVPLLFEATRQHQTVLFEGAQGTLLDVDFGTYPYVTSSNATAGGACTGSGVGPTRIDSVIGVMKAYLTRVGEGPFPTELTDATGQELRDIGQEYGTTTGRPRRCGWFDAVIGRYSVMVNGLDGVAITKLDVMDNLDAVKICTGYRHRETGEAITDFPAQLHLLENVEPVYETLPGWKSDSSEARSEAELPGAARRYLARVSELIGAPVTIISVGPERNQTIILDHPILGASRQRSATAAATPCG